MITQRGRMRPSLCLRAVIAALLLIALLSVPAGANAFSRDSLTVPAAQRLTAGRAAPQRQAPIQRSRQRTATASRPGHVLKDKRHVTNGRPRHTNPHAHASIIGGTIAESGTFPSLAYIADFTNEEEVGLCTGTVVASNVILTAAHCAEDVETGVLNEPADYRIVTGNVDWASAPRQVSTVSRIIVYPGFAPGVLDRDAALLVLATPTTAPAISLWATGTVHAGTAALIAGWGQTYFERETLTERLRWANTAVQGPEWCALHAPPFYEHDELCAINPPSYSTGVCHGDSGGPLLASGPSGLFEIGITSHGYGECSTAEPSVFTRTDLIHTWVHEWAEAVKPPPPPPAAPTPPPPAPQTTVPTTPPQHATVSPTPLPIEGVYRGTTSQSSIPISLIVGSGGHRVTAVATKIIYRCRSGRTITEPMEGLSNGEPEPITASHTFTVRFSSGPESETVTGTIDPTSGDISGTLAAKWLTRRYGLCSTGRVSWTAQRSATESSTTPLATVGNYSGWTNQNGHILLTVSSTGRALTNLEFSATYECRQHHSVHKTVSFLTPTEPWALESFGTFTVPLGGHSYSGRVDGTFGLLPNNAVFGTFQASTLTRYGHCLTGVVPWET